MQDGPRRSALISSARYAGLGFEFAGTIVAGVLVGYYLDGWLGTAPLLTLVFTLGAMAGAVSRLIWNLKQNTSTGRR